MRVLTTILSSLWISLTSVCVLASDEQNGLYDPLIITQVADTNYEAAWSLGEQYLSAFEQADDEENVLRTYYYLGVASFYQGDFDSAIEAFKSASEKEYIQNYPKRAGSIFNNLGVCYMFQGEYQRALESYEKSYFIDLKLEDVFSRHQVLVNIAYINYKLGYNDFAENFLRLSYKYFKSERDKYHLAKVVQNLGLIYSERGDYSASIEAFNEALDAFKAVDDSISMSQIYYELSYQYAVQENYDQSFLNYTIGSDMAYKVGDRTLQARYEFLKAMILEVKGFNTEAIDQYEKSLSSFQAVSNYEMELEVYERLALLSEDLKWKDTAKDYEAKALDLKQHLDSNAVYMSTNVLVVNQRIKDAELVVCANEGSKMKSWFFGALGLAILLLGGFVVFWIKYRQLLKVPKETETENVETMLFTERLAELSSAEDILNDAEIGQRRVASAFIEKMVEDKIYLIDDLTVGKAADMIETNERTLSKAIKTYYNSSFNNFINSFRVNESKIILAKDTDKRLTIDEIAFQSGFTNRQTFFRVFKQHMGISPSEYRDQGHNQLSLNQAISDMEALKNLRKLSAVL